MVRLRSLLSGVVLFALGVSVLTVAASRIGALGFASVGTPLTSDEMCNLAGSGESFSACLATSHNCNSRNQTTICTSQGQSCTRCSFNPAEDACSSSPNPFDVCKSNQPLSCGDLLQNGSCSAALECTGGIDLGNNCTVGITDCQVQC